MDAHTNAHTSASLPRVVIVGAGFGGLRAARALAHAPVAVTVIDRNNHHLFQPLLYQVATAELSPADISAPIRHVLRRQRNADVLLGEVTRVETTRRRVLVRDRAGAHDRTLTYDYLILATGAGQSYFGHDAWQPFAPGLKSIEDATAQRRKILLAFEAAEAEAREHPAWTRALLTFVVVGGGPTGVELAGAIAEVARHALTRDFRHINPASARILLVEAGPRLLPAFPPSLAEAATAKLRRLGVEVRVGCAVEDVTGESVTMGGERVAARTVIWAAGVRASAAGQWIGAETDRVGRVLVQPDCSVPGHPEIFVLGDTASVNGGDGKPLPGVAPVAMQQGRHVAHVLAARVRGDERELPFRYVDKGTLATVGRSYAIADIHGLRLRGLLGWLTWMVVHIFYLIGFRNRLLVMLQWAWAYLSYQRGARLITNLDVVPHAAATTASPPSTTSPTPVAERG
ncbi:MAG: NAD(P)/FAD-dependent oxidoreductase [Ktedonobacterales bacterium]|nr:NAD(P)/FAD-dependent oxidoreductase [Ktedonobacterales bacterium]